MIFVRRVGSKPLVVTRSSLTTSSATAGSLRLPQDRGRLRDGSGSRPRRRPLPPNPCVRRVAPGGRRHRDGTGQAPREGPFPATSWLRRVCELHICLARCKSLPIPVRYTTCCAMLNPATGAMCASLVCNTVLPWRVYLWWKRTWRAQTRSPKT